MSEESLTAKELAEAELAKAEAELAKAEAKKAKAEAEAAHAKAEAESEKWRAQARKLVAEASITEIALLREQRRETEELAQNKYHHVYAFTDGIGSTSVSNCINQLTLWMRNDPGCPIDIIFKSPGGSVIDGMALFDFIQELRAKNHYVTTMALGWAASMAGILLQAGDKRVIGREAYVLIHEISSLAIGKIGEMEDELKFLKKIQGRILDIFSSRSHVSRAYFARGWKRKDWWLDSEECLKIGFVDEVR